MGRKRRGQKKSRGRIRKVVDPNYEGRLEWSGLDHSCLKSVAKKEEKGI